MKIMTILGARPQFIKASVVSDAISKSKYLTEKVIHTGQHFDSNMSEIFFKELGMRTPDYHLNVHGGTHGAMTGRMLERIEQVLMAEKPEAVLVYGDTNSTLAGALAAAKLHIPVAHVEAGLRSFNLQMPEEINRILTDRVSRWLFAPTEAAVCHLQREGVGGENIKLVGDVMYDVALHHGKRVSELGGVLQELNLEAGRYMLLTVHRAENTDQPARLMEIIKAMEVVSNSIKIVWPLHPRTRAVLVSLGHLNRLAQKIHVIDPVGYMDMVQLEKYAALIVTDSGGVQKEAFFYQVPCVTLRYETEWMELIDSGWNRLAPPMNADTLISTILYAINSKGRSVQPYGSGNAAKQIVDFLSEMHE
jgi:UDP-GlcNAc3NAcA epimerase